MSPSFLLLPRYLCKQVSQRLKPTESVLLINVPVALLLLAVLEHHGNAKHEKDVDADDSKSGGEDLVEVLVGEGGEFADATALLRGNQRVLACAVLDEWRGSGVDVAAAVEPLLQETLDKRRLTSPEHAEVPARLESFDPDGYTKTEGKGCTDDDQPALSTKPAAVGGEEKCGKREQEGHKDEDCIDHTGCQGTLAEQQILGDIVHGRRGSHGLLRNEGEAQQQASAGGEEKVHTHKGHHQLGRHLGGIVRIRQRERGLAKESKMNGR